MSFWPPRDFIRRHRPNDSASPLPLPASAPGDPALRKSRPARCHPPIDQTRRVVQGSAVAGRSEHRAGRDGRTRPDRDHFHRGHRPVHRLDPRRGGNRVWCPGVSRRRFPAPVGGLFCHGVGAVLVGGVGGGGALSLWNGWLVRRLKIPAIIVTLAGLAFYRGLALVLADLAIPNFGGNI